MPTTISSNKVVARLTRSWWPRVIGSNVPGYTALIIGLPHQNMKMHVPRARAPENNPAARRLEGGVALHVYPPPRGEQPAQRSERRDLHAQTVRRIDESEDARRGARKDHQYRSRRGSQRQSEHGRVQRGEKRGNPDYREHVG